MALRKDVIPSNFNALAAAAKGRLGSITGGHSETHDVPQQQQFHLNIPLFSLI